MSWFKQLSLSLIVLSAAAPCVSCQELISTLRQGNRTCPGEEVIFNCIIRGSSTVSAIVLEWSSGEYIVGHSGSIQFSIENMIGEIETSTDMDGNITAIATLTNNTIIDNGVRVLQSTLRITATVASTVTCRNSGTGGTKSIQFSISAIPGAPRNVRAAQISQDNDNNCIILVTWDPPSNVDESDIDHYIITIPSRNIMETESSAIIALRIPNCHGNDSIQVTAVNRFGCVGENSLQTRPSLLDSIAASTPIGSTTSTSIGSDSTSASTSVIAAASIAAVLFVVLCVVVVLGLILFGVLYKRGKTIQAAGQVLPPDVLRLEEHVETETKLIDDLQNRIQDTLVKRNLEVLYNAMKLKLPSRNMQTAARDLRATLILGRDSSEFNENVKEAFISYLEALQSENDEVVQRFIENMDNILTGMTGIGKDFKQSVRLLRTKVGTDDYKEVLDDFIKRVETVKPSTIMSTLLSLCEKLRNVRQVKDYYCKQSKYDIDKLGTGEDRVSVPIWMDDELDDGWKASLREAMKAINEAAPGLSLSITEDSLREQAIVHVLAIDKKDLEQYTEVEGNILIRSKEKKFITKIRLGKWKDDWKKGVCIHELFHALGFHHEHQDAIAAPYVYRLDSGKEITIDKNELGFIQFDSSSTTQYPCEKKCSGNSEDHVCIWVLKAYPIQENIDLDELDMVGLNLVYPPCVDETTNNVRYRPKIGRNGMYYCEREAMIGRTYPGEEYNYFFCGPDKGPNCPACRTIRSPKVEEILAGGRWQGMTGRVYCGRPFADPGILFPSHDGMCGMNNGPACDDCNDILNKEHVRPRASSMQ